LPQSTPHPYTTLFRSKRTAAAGVDRSAREQSRSTLHPEVSSLPALAIDTAEVYVRRRANRYAAAGAPGKRGRNLLSRVQTIAVLGGGHMTEDRTNTGRDEHSDSHQPAMSRRTFLAVTAAGSAALFPGGLSSLFRAATAVAGSNFQFVEKTIPQLQAAMAAGQITARELVL